MSTYSAELVRPGKSGQNYPIANMNVTGKGRIISEDRVAADMAIVRYVHIGHDPVVIAHCRLAVALHRAAANGAELANRIAIPDGQRGWLIGVFLVLWIVAD
jgi:hypothetical protein